MAVSNFNDDLNIIAGLGNNPNSDNNLSDTQLKQTFDKAGLLIQRFLNNVLIPAVNKIETAVGFKGTHNELTGRDAANQHPMSAITGLSDALASANNTAANALSVAMSKASVVTETVILYADEWGHDTKSLVVSSATVPLTAKVITVAPDPGDENYAAYTECGVRCISQSADGLTFQCDDVPDIDLTVNLAGFL